MDGWRDGGMDVSAQCCAAAPAAQSLKTGAYRPGRGEERVLLWGLHSRPRVIVGIETILLIVEASRRGGVV